MKPSIFILLTVIMCKAACHKRVVDPPKTVIDTSEIIQDLTATYPQLISRHPIVVGVLPLGKRFIAIISGDSPDGNDRQGASGAVIFNQSLEEMVSSGDVLLPDVGRPLEDVYPELVAKVYSDKPNPEALSMMCIQDSQCFLFAKTGPNEMTTFDLYNPQKAPCVVPQLWDRLETIFPNPVIPLPSGRSDLSYFSYQMFQKGSYDEDFTGSLDLTFSTEVTYTDDGMCISYLNQTTAPVRYLCDTDALHEFTYQKEECGDDMFTKFISAGFAYKEHVYLIPEYGYEDDYVLRLPLTGFEEGNPNVTYTLEMITRADFWSNSSYFL